MKKIFIPSLLAASVALSSCDDFLSAYSQDQIVAKEVSHFDEVILGSGYLQSVALADGPSVGNVGGFFNVLDDDVKADKVLVFKKIRRKGFQKLNGHRQKLTKIKINEIA